MFVDKDLESKIKDDLRLDQEILPETEVDSFMLKALVSDSLYCFSYWSLTRLHSRKRPALVTTTFSNSWSLTRAFTVYCIHVQFPGAAGSKANLGGPR